MASPVRRARGRRPLAVLRVRGLPHRPPAAAGGGEPRRCEPRRLAGPGGPAPPLAGGGVGGLAGDAARAPSGGGAVVSLSLELYRSVPRYVAARAVGERFPGLLAGPVAPLRLVNREVRRLPGDGWARVWPRLAGICGSDLSTIAGRSSFYFSPLVSMPFVPGHKVVGELVDDVDGLSAGTRVVLDPVLACAARGLELCPSCAAGATGRCDRVTVGHVSPGLQTGYCAETGGGWSRQLVAHRSQLHAIPDRMS